MTIGDPIRSLVRKMFNPSRKSVPARPEPDIADPGASDIGLRDAMESGMFQNGTGELYPGFPVSAADVALDVGCGDGGKANFCAGMGAEVIFVDIDPAQVEMAEKRLAGTAARRLTPIVSDCNPLPLENGVATRIIASEVIEHVDDPKQFLAELVRVGCSGALYLLTVPDPVIEELQRPFAPDVYFEKPNHIRVIGRDEFATMVMDAGLTIERRGSHGFYWSIWWCLFWACGVDLSAPHHPALENWAKAWQAFLDTPQGPRIKQTLDDFLPISQYVVARKP